MGLGLGLGSGFVCAGSHHAMGLTKPARSPSSPVASVVAAAHASKIAIRSGNMYGVRLLEDLNIDPEVGVVRVSLVHYNTEEEVAALITALNEVLLG